MGDNSSSNISAQLCFCLHFMTNLACVRVGCCHSTQGFSVQALTSDRIPNGDNTDMKYWHFYNITGWNFFYCCKHQLCIPSTQSYRSPLMRHEAIHVYTLLELHEQGKIYIRWQWIQNSTQTSQRVVLKPRAAFIKSIIIKLLLCNGLAF